MIFRTPSHIPCSCCVLLISFHRIASEFIKHVLAISNATTASSPTTEAWLGTAHISDLSTVASKSPLSQYPERSGLYRVGIGFIAALTTYILTIRHPALYTTCMVRLSVKPPFQLLTLLPMRGEGSIFSAISSWTSEPDLLAASKPSPNSTLDSLNARKHQGKPRIQLPVLMT